MRRRQPLSSSPSPFRFSVPGAIALMAVLSACSFESSSYTVLPRTGPEFATAFPDPAVLLSDRDSTEMRKVLDTIPLPETDAHHDRLVEVVKERDGFDTDHLILLTEAVALPGRTGDEVAKVKSKSTATYTTMIDGRVVVWSRGKGKYSGTVDEILRIGAPKVTDPGPKNLGRVLRVSQSKESLVSLAAQLQQGWDDGSPAAIGEILDGAGVDTVRLEICIDSFLPAGRLDEARADVAITKMAFDSGRLRLMQADYGRRTTLATSKLIEHVKLMSFDDGRTKGVALGAGLVRDVNGADALQLVKTASFDAGRIKILRTIKDRVALSGVDEALALVRTASFDSGRSEILGTLASGSFPKVSGPDLVVLARTASFDADRAKLLRLVKPHLGDELTADTARELLSVFAFGSGRKKVVEMFKDQLRDLPASERSAILDVFSFDSEKDAVRATLGW